MYKLNYNRVTGKMFDISLVTKKPFGSIDVTEEDKALIYSKKNEGYCVIVDSGDFTFSFCKPFDEVQGLIDIIAIRDVYILDQTFHHTTWYQEKLLEVDGIVVDEVTLKAYYFRLFEVKAAYEACTDKANFSFVEVDEYSESPVDTDFEIVLPDFIRQ